MFEQQSLTGNQNQIDTILLQEKTIKCLKNQIQELFEEIDYLEIRHSQEMSFQMEMLEKNKIQYSTKLSDLESRLKEEQNAKEQLHQKNIELQERMKVLSDSEVTTRNRMNSLHLQIENLEASLQEQLLVNSQCLQDRSIEIIQSSISESVLFSASIFSLSPSESLLSSTNVNLRQIEYLPAPSWNASTSNSNHPHIDDNHFLFVSNAQENVQRLNSMLSFFYNFRSSIQSCFQHPGNN
jgi:chromosome segregation ATPase